MAYLESKLKTELVEALERAGCVAHKFPDLARGIKKPHDLVCGIGGFYVGIETKLKKIGTCANPGRWAPQMVVVKFCDLTVLQEKALAQTEQRGSIAVVIAGIYDQYDDHREAFAFSYRKFRERDVWTYSECVAYGGCLTWAKGRGWDVESLIQPIVMRELGDGRE